MAIFDFKLMQLLFQMGGSLLRPWKGENIYRKRG